MPRSTLTWTNIYIYIWKFNCSTSCPFQKGSVYKVLPIFEVCIFTAPARRSCLPAHVEPFFHFQNSVDNHIYIYICLCVKYIYIYIYILNVYCIYACVCTYANHKCICFSYCTPFDSVFPLLSYDFMVYLFHRLQLSLLELCCTFHVFHVVY